MWFLATLLLAPLLADEFGDVWYDGKAEVDGYRWRGERYGELRTGEAVAIFVTEPFDEEAHVKLDRSGGGVTALKLNLVRDFQTGVYDYNTMVSCFVRADDLAPMKVSFTSAEWCGHVYEELDVRPKTTTLVTRSYFEGESREVELPTRPEGIVADEHLLLWLRGLHGHVLAPGESRVVPFLAGPFERRLRHRPAEWGEANVFREPETAEVRVPAGSFDAVTYRVEVSDGRRAVVRIEAEYPHRLLTWEWTRGDTVLDAAELTGSVRMRYWERHAEGDEKLRASLGLESR